MQDFYIYPAVFTYQPEGIGITFPDLPGCFSEGVTDNDAFQNATEALELHLWSMEQDHDEIPTPTPIQAIQLEENEVVVLIRANMRLTRMDMSERAVRKMVTLPRWLNNEAEAQGVNFSQILQAALKDYLAIHRKAS